MTRSSDRSWIARRIAAHRAVEARLRRESREVWPPHPAGLAARVEARLTQLRERAERGDAPRPAAEPPAAKTWRAAPAWRLATAAALLLVLALGLGSRLRTSPLPAAPPVAGAPGASSPEARAGAEERLARLVRLPHVSGVRLGAALDRPLLDEVERLERETRSIGRSFVRRLPVFLLRSDE